MTNNTKQPGHPTGSRAFTPEHKAALSAAKKGKKRKPFTTEHKAALSAAKKGKTVFTDEHRAALSAAAKRRWANNTNNIDSDCRRSTNKTNEEPK